MRKFCLSTTFRKNGEKTSFPLKNPQKNLLFSHKSKRKFKSKKNYQIIFTQKAILKTKAKISKLWEQLFSHNRKNKSEKLKMAVFLKKLFWGVIFFFFGANGVPVLVERFIFHMLVSIFNSGKFQFSRAQSKVENWFRGCFFSAVEFQKKKKSIGEIDPWLRPHKISAS